MGKNNNGANQKLRITLRFILGFGIVISLVIGLGILRFHAARLAYYLESVNQSIQKYSDEEVILRQELSALVAPIRIYSYCKESLGMQKVMKAETLPVQIKTSVRAASRNEAPSGVKGWRSGLAWLLGR
ncbi:MAG: hypothetical protein IJR98_05445 [Synergistaceae bacterium]|nr:hypothetical protein [Synergistaceae bacterium]MBQ7266961.1 hypothetical protein [Synergistaceae bacterium]